MRKKQNFQWKEMTMGTCYYPEHWPEKLWTEDLERMKKVGISVIRIAEFAWSKIEPEEGVITYDFFDRFLQLCLEKDMKVIFGTPSATPPAWLTEKYPEVLNGAIDGTLYRHGGRRHYNYNSAVYRKLVSNIVEKAASHYGSHPAIVGWQIDNELNCETCEFYSEADNLAFRNFLREKYTSLETLNEAWGTVFWNQTYTQWDQIYLPRPLLNNGYNPHMHLDYFRFVSESAVSFCRMQAEIIARYRKEGDFITTNGMFWNLDNHRMMDECLDVYTYDSYPNFAFSLDRYPVDEEALNDRRWSKNLTEVRSICPHFGIMEQQSGANGWTTRMEGPAPRPGQLSLWAMQSIAHGADYISFFRWRTCTFGTEIYWHGILDYDNRDNRKLAEVAEFYANMRKLDPICGSEYTASFGILKDYDNSWDTNVDVWHERIAKQSEEEIFRFSQLRHRPCDVIYLKKDMEPEDLFRYPALIYPHPAIVTAERAEILRAYVKQGGVLILGCRSGYKEEHGKCVMMPQPGLLQELTGSDVKEFTFVSSADGDLKAVWDDAEMSMPLFNDVLQIAEGCKEARVLACYESGYYAGEAALIERKAGKGSVLHLGSAFSMQNLERLMDYAKVPDLFSEKMEAPESVELVHRKREGKEYIFALNYLGREQELFLKKNMYSLLTGLNVEGRVTMPPYGAAVFTPAETF